MSSPQIEAIPQQKQNSKFSNLFRCANKTDYQLLTVGIFLAALQGVGMPIFSLLWGNLVDTLVGE